MLEPIEAMNNDYLTDDNSGDDPDLPDRDGRDPGYEADDEPAPTPETLAMQQLSEKLANETKLRAMEYRNGTLSMEMEPALEIAASFVACARAILGDAPNYTESKYEWGVSLAESTETWTFVVQRHAPGVMTPHEARMKAERERDTALSRIATLEAAVREHRDTCNAAATVAQEDQAHEKLWSEITPETEPR